MFPTFSALDSIRESGITIVSDGAEYKSKSFEKNKKIRILTLSFRNWRF